MLTAFALWGTWFACATVSGDRSGAGAVATLAGACTGCVDEENPVGSVVIRGATVVGVGLADVVIQEGRITDVSNAAPAGELAVIDGTGQFLVPGFIDNHVHFAYLPRQEEMLDRGVVASVDLAAPLSFFDEPTTPMRLLSSGPMVTAVGGYPTQSWGRGGYGLECADSNEAIEAVNTVYAAGARVIKLPVTTGDQLAEAAMVAAVGRAHELGMKVVSHALGDEEAQLAARVGVDVLAHTPTQTLSAETVQQWSSKAVISTLLAFGGSDSALANLTSLRDAGATILYGTDFGNRSVIGADPYEIAALQKAGMSPAEVLAAATSVPAAYFGFDDLGSVEVGKAGSVVLLPRDPLVDPSVLAEPTVVIVDGLVR